MAEKKPLCLYSGAPQELQSGDTLPGGGGSGECLQLEVSSSGHGFSNLKAIRYNGSGGYCLAQADSGVNAEVLGLITEVTDANNFVVTLDGQVTSSGHGFTTNETYYLSTASAGELTTTAPSTIGQFIKPVMNVPDANTLRILDHPSQEITTADSGALVYGCLFMERVSPTNETTKAFTVTINSANDYHYTVKGRVKNDSGGAITVYLYINGDATATNYYSMYSQHLSGAAIVPGRLNNPSICYLANGDECNFDCQIKISPSGYVSFNSVVDRHIQASSTVERLTYTGSKTATVASITGITIGCDTANGLRTGSTFDLYRWH